MSLIERLFGGGSDERRTVELTPDEQVALAALLHLGETSGATLRAAVESRGGVRWEPPHKAIAELLAKELIAVSREDGETTYYVATKLGARLRDRLMENPRSTVEYRL